MRVHPKHFTQQSRKERPLAMALLITTIFVFGWRDTEQNRAAATQTNRVSRIQVFVAADDIAANVLLRPENVVREIRTVESLPPDVLTDISDIIGKRTTVAIKKGSPLVRDQQLATPDTLSVAVADSGEIRGDIPLPHLSTAVKSQKFEKSQKQVIANSKPTKNKLSSPSLPKEKPVPVPNLRMNKKTLDAQSAARRKGGSYVWVPGGAFKYEVSTDGGIQVITPNGASQPLAPPRQAVTGDNS